jgi:hypothetical protein
LSAPEQEQLEARYFADDALFEQLLSVEDDLIDRYARGEIDAAEQARLERHFMKSPGRRQRARFAATWLRHIGRQAAGVWGQRRSWWRELMARLRLKTPS